MKLAAEGSWENQTGTSVHWPAGATGASEVVTVSEGVAEPDAEIEVVVLDSQSRPTSLHLADDGVSHIVVESVSKLLIIRGRSPCELH